MARLNSWGVAVAEATILLVRKFELRPPPWHHPGIRRASEHKGSVGWAGGISQPGKLPPTGPTRSQSASLVTLPCSEGAMPTAATDTDAPGCTRPVHCACGGPAAPRAGMPERKPDGAVDEARGTADSSGAPSHLLPRSAPPAPSHFLGPISAFAIHSLEQKLFRVPFLSCSWPTCESRAKHRLFSKF